MQNTMITCERCKRQREQMFEPLYENVCRTCLTDKEMIEYVQPWLTKLMADCDVHEKRKLIKTLMREHQKFLRSNA